jgi:hypothetical protein
VLIGVAVGNFLDPFLVQAGDEAHESPWVRFQGVGRGKVYGGSVEILRSPEIVPCEGVAGVLVDSNKINVEVFGNQIVSSSVFGLVTIGGDNRISLICPFVNVKSKSCPDQAEPEDRQKCTDICLVLVRLLEPKIERRAESVETPKLHGTACQPV